MPRKMRPAPDDVMIVKTTRGTWIALYEIWSEDGELLDVRPMRPNKKQPINQASERREMVLLVESALMKTRVNELEQRLQDLLSGGASGSSPGVRYAATG